MQLVSISPSTSQVGKFIILSWQRNPGEVNESFLARPSLARNEKKSWLQPFVVLPNLFKIEINCRIVHAYAIPRVSQKMAVLMGAMLTIGKLVHMG